MVPPPPPPPPTTSTSTSVTPSGTEKMPFEVNSTTLYPNSACQFIELLPTFLISSRAIALEIRQPIPGPVSTARLSTAAIKLFLEWKSSQSAVDVSVRVMPFSSCGLTHPLIVTKLSRSRVASSAIEMDPAPANSCARPTRPSMLDATVPIPVPSFPPLESLYSSAVPSASSSKCQSETKLASHTLVTSAPSAAVRFPYSSVITVFCELDMVGTLTQYSAFLLAKSCLSR